LNKFLKVNSLHVAPLKILDTANIKASIGQKILRHQ